MAYSFQESAISSSLFTKDCLKEKKEYLVKAVFDGDTILIRIGETAMGRPTELGEPRPKGAGRDSKKEFKIRLLGIDAFEHDQYPYGPKGKDFLTMLVLNKKVCVETDVQENDVYNRTLGYVFLDKALVNEGLVKNGLALLYDFPPNIKYIDKLKKAQIFARQNKLGVWEKHSYIKETPAQWRHKHPFKKEKTNLDTLHARFHKSF